MYNLFLEEKRKKVKEDLDKKEREIKKYKAKFKSKKKYIKSFFN
jgi:hypothetical protein